MPLGLHSPGELDAAIAAHEFGERCRLDPLRPEPPASPVVCSVTSLARRFGGSGIRRGIRGSGGAPAPFLPLDLTPHAWYREIYASGTWTDLSGNGNDVVQAAPSAQPTQVTRYGQDVLSFDGGDNMAGAFHAALTQPYTVVCVLEPNDIISPRSVYDSDDGTNRMELLVFATTGVVNIFSGVSHVADPVTAATVAAVFSETDGASSSIWVDDWTDGAVDSGNQGAHLPDGLTVGADFLGNNDWFGFIAELIIYSRSLTTAERKDIGDYLTARYDGLTVTT